MNGFLVKSPGILTTIQDSGRYGYQWSGISPAGAMDLHSLRLANILLDNDMDEAGLEITIVGPELLFECDETIAITGADLSPTLNGHPISNNCAVSVSAGDTLKFGANKSGTRAYLAFAGGLAIESTMGSRSTLLRNKLGSLGGRALKKDDVIGLRMPKKRLPGQGQRIVRSEPQDNRNITLRVIMGPQDDLFTEAGIASFLSQEGYRVTDQFSRHGYRLEGPKIQHKNGGDIVSDGIALGAVQVPTNGQPIIMLAERQSTGGYTKIANVITVDLPKIGQCGSGARVRFQAVSVEEAQALLATEFDELKRIQARMKALNQCSYYRVMINGQTYQVEISKAE